MAHILVVDDDTDVLGTVWRALSRDGHDVMLADSVAQAREHMQRRMPDLIVLDIMMPDEDGLEFCRELRRDGRYQRIPLLFLSARWRTDDIVRGLDVGGDDYLTKPFELKELNARVRALLRRALPLAEGTTARLVVGGLELDTRTYQVSTPEVKDIQLTSTEYRLLYYLMAAPDEAHSVNELLDAVWQYPSGTGDPDLVRSHIRNLRNKIEPNPSEPRYIHTIHGVGYMVKS